MKTIKLLAVVALFISLASCNKKEIHQKPQGVDPITFSGSFSRDFQAQTAQRATYTITDNLIKYSLTGGQTANYTIDKKYFSKQDNRWIGKREDNNKYYVIFFKDISNNSITIYKKTVVSLAEGKTTPLPSATDTANFGWNQYATNLPISGKVKNLEAPVIGGEGAPASGSFVKFSFATGAKTDSNTDWDIAFRATTILVNGGAVTGLAQEPVRNGQAAAYIATGTFDEIKSVKVDLLKQDATTGLAIQTDSDNGWYHYTGSPLHLINPIPGKVLVFKTHDGKYAKIEITSYYKNSDNSDNSQNGYYNFNYVYQPNQGVTTLK